MYTSASPHRPRPAVPEQKPLVLPPLFAQLGKAPDGRCPERPCPAVLDERYQHKRDRAADQHRGRQAHGVPRDERQDDADAKEPASGAPKLSDEAIVGTLGEVHASIVGARRECRIHRERRVRACTTKRRIFAAGLKPRRSAALLRIASPTTLRVLREVSSP
jgi:hypothetical protein